MIGAAETSTAMLSPLCCTSRESDAPTWLNRSASTCRTGPSIKSPRSSVSWKTDSMVFPTAAARCQPVSVSATGFMNVT